MTQQLFARRFALAGAAAAALTASPLRAAEFEFKCGSAYTPEEPSSVRLTQMWKAIEHESGGRIRTQLFLSSVLGGAPAMLSQVRLGAIDFLLAGGAFGAVVPLADICYLGFAFPNAEVANHVYEGPMGTYLRNEAAARGLYVLRTIWESEMRHVGSNSHQIHNPDDLHAFKIKVLGKISTDLFKALGANPVEIPLAEAYTALQTRLIDGEDSTLDNINASRLYEVNKSVTLTNQSWGGQFLIMNGESWKRLPPDLQALMERNNTKYGRLNAQDLRYSVAAVGDKLKRQGMTIIGGINQAPYRARLHSYYEYWANAFGPTAWGLLQNSLSYKLL